MSKGVIPLLLGIVASLASTINIVNQINTIVQAVHNLLFPPGPQLDFQTEQTQVASIQAHVLDPTYGLQAIEAEISANQTALIAAIAALPQVGDPVVLPTTPPTGYGSTDAASIAAAVWASIGPTSSIAAMAMLENCAGLTQNWSDWPQQLQFNQYAGWEMLPLEDWNTPIASTDVCVPLDFSSVLPTDDNATDWINRIAGPGLVIDLGGGAPGNLDSFGNLFYVPWLDRPTFQILRDKQLGLGQTNLPPIWPGVAGVTLGSPVSLVDGLTITADIQGVIVAILTAPPGKAKYIYGSVTAYQHIGALSFEDDNSDQESFQALEFQTQVYLPKSMVTSAGVRFKVNPGVTGTVTPFTIP